MRIKAPRVALYARYSTDMQSPLSIEDQFRQAERHAKQQGWQVVERFSDHAVSGSIGNDPPGFQKLKKALETGAFDIVLAESVARISRDQEHTAGFYKLARFHGVEIHTTSHGKVDALRLSMSAAMNALYLEELAFNTRRGLEGRIAKGMSAGGRSYGYKKGVDANGAPMTGVLQLDEVQAAVVQRIFREFVSGISPLKIAAKLNDDGIPAPTVGTGRLSSGHWKQNTINGNPDRGTGILNNTLYIGRRIWNRQTYTKNPSTERRVSRLNPKSEWRVSEVPELRIVDQELWDEAKARQAAQSRRRARTPSTDRNHLSTGQALRRRKYLLSGLLICQRCGGQMTVAGAGKYRSYYCANAKEKGASVCKGFRGLHESKAAEMVLSALRTELMQPEAYALFRDEFHAKLISSQSGAQDALRLHDNRQRELEDTHRHLMDAVGRGKLGEVLEDHLIEVDRELKAMRAKRDEIVPPAVELP